MLEEDNLYDLFADNDDNVEHKDESWNQLDSDFEQNFLDFLSSKKQYIKKWDVFRKGNIEASTQSELTIQAIIEDYHRIISDLEKQKKSIVKAFSLGKVTKNQLDRHDYPPSMRLYHMTRSLGLALLVAAPLAYGGLAFFGGPNSALWSNSLIWGRVLPFTLPIGAGLLTAGTILSKKSFKRENVNSKKLNFIEKLIMKRVLKKEKALLSITNEIANKMPEILNGDFNLYETKTVMRRKFIFFGEKRPVQVKRAKPQYRDLPFFKRIKISRLLSKFKKLSVQTASLEKILDTQKAKKAVQEEERRAQEERRRAQEERIRKAVDEQVRRRKTVSETPTEVPPSATRDSRVSANRQQILEFMREEDGRRKRRPKNTTSMPKSASTSTDESAGQNSESKPTEGTKKSKPKQ